MSKDVFSILNSELRFNFQLGVALGFVVPVSVVHNQKDEDKVYLIGHDLFNMFLGVAIITTVLLVVIIVGKSF